MPCDRGGSKASRLAQLGSRFANDVADRLLDKPRGLYPSTFRCMSGLVAQSVRRYQGPIPYVDGLIMKVTQRIDSIEGRHLLRTEGRSYYDPGLLWLDLSLAANGKPRGTVRSIERNPAAERAAA